MRVHIASLLQTVRYHSYSFQWSTGEYKVSTCIQLSLGMNTVPLLTYSVINGSFFSSISVLPQLETDLKCLCHILIPLDNHQFLVVLTPPHYGLHQPAILRVVRQPPSLQLVTRVLLPLQVTQEKWVHLFLPCCVQVILTNIWNPHAQCSRRVAIVNELKV